MRKKIPIAKVQAFGVFLSRLDQIITTSTSNRSKMHLKSFFSKTVNFCIFHLKNIDRKTTVPKQCLIFDPIKCS